MITIGDTRSWLLHRPGVKLRTSFEGDHWEAVVLAADGTTVLGQGSSAIDLDSAINSAIEASEA